MRRAIPFAILAACLGVGVLPALAAPRDVGIHDYAFSPSRVAVLPGESVTWAAEPGYASAMHNVHFEGEAAALGAPSAGFTATRRFDAEGEFRYYCDVHEYLGMRGTVYVNSTGTVPPSPTTSPAPTADPTPGGSPTPSPSGSPTPYPPTNTGGSGAAVSAFKARAARSHFCTSRSASCKKPGVFLLIDLDASRSVRVRGTLRRSSKRVRAVSVRMRPGKRRVRLPGRRLKPGRYTLTLRAGDITRRVRFAVRPS